MASRISCEEVVRILDRDPGRVLCVDIETTGLDPDVDGILSVAVIDGTGGVRFRSLIRPHETSWWPEAQSVNGISPDMVRDAPGIAHVADRISEVLADAEAIVGYNHIRFDIPFLRSHGIAVPEVPLCDVMREFARVVGDWVKLTECARHCGVTWYAAHDALGDAMATLECARRIAEDAGRKAGDRAGRPRTDSRVL